MSTSRIALLGVCGGVAAYKAVDVASRLRKAGWEVHVALSEAAGAFVTPLTFAAVTGHRVLDRLFVNANEASGDALYPHLYPSTRAALFLLLPATADMIARIAHGHGSDIVSTCALSLPATCRRVFCPAMNVEMWRQPVVGENVRKLEALGWTRIGPVAGPLACGMAGEGRMSEPADIVAGLDAPTIARANLAGRRVLIVSGPTREHLDPVRFIGNPSSGRMGQALAEEAMAAGATVDFVTGPVAPANLPRGAEITPVTSAEDMLAAAAAGYARADIAIYAAAVADYRPVVRHERKLPKKGGRITVDLEATPDVAATLNAGKRKGQVAIGFALQTHDGAKNARAKLERKHLDGIVLNGLDALGGDSGTYTWIGARAGRAPEVEPWGKLDKSACARRILAEAAARLSPR